MDNKTITLLLLAAGGYYAYTRFVKPGKLYYKLPSGQLVAVETAAQVLPGLGYRLTAYGWIHESILAQLAQMQGQGSSSSAINSFVAAIPQIWSTATQLYNYISQNFSQEEIDGNILSENFDLSDSGGYV